MAEDFTFQETSTKKFIFKEEEEEEKKFIFKEPKEIPEEVTIFGSTFKTRTGEYVPDEPIEKEKPFNFEEDKIIEKGALDTYRETGELVNPYKHLDRAYFRTFVGAGRDILQSTRDVLNWMLPGDPLGKTPLPQVAEPEYMGGRLIRDITGFLVPFGAISKVGQLGKLPAVGQAVSKVTGAKKGFIFKSAAKGGLAEQFAFSPFEHRISNLIENFPNLQNPITDFLKADTEDSESEARAKMFLEGSIIGVPVDWLFTSLSRYKNAGGTSKALKIDDKKLFQQKLKEQNKILKEEANRVEKIIGKKPRSLEGEIIPDELSIKTITPKLRKKIEGFAEELFVTATPRVTRNKYLDLNEQIADLLITNRIGDDAFKALLGKHKISFNDFARMYAKSTSEAARTLQNLSRISLRIKKTLKNASKADLEEYNNIQQSQGLDEEILFNSFLKRLDNVRRAAMVGQLATAARNLFSQQGRVGIDVIEQSIDWAVGSALRTIFRRSSLSKKPSNPITAMGGLIKIFRQIDPDYFTRVKKEVNDILQYYPVEQDRLFLRYSSDILNKVGGKLDGIGVLERGVHLLNIFNRFQEFITRRAVFQATLDALIRSKKSFYKGRTLNQIISDPNLIKTISKKDIAIAIDHALEMTYASPAKGKLSKAFVSLVNSLPFLATLAIPFPRFLINSLKFQYQFSPLSLIPSLMKLATKPKRFLAGDVNEVVRSIMGSAMLYGAVQLRLQPYAGEKWNEFKVGDKTIDIIPYNPLAAYLYAGDLLVRTWKGTLRPSQYDLKQLSRVFAGTRAGTGVYLIDELIKISQGESKWGARTLTDLIGKVAAQFLTPFRTYADFYYANDPVNEAIKETRGDPIVYDSLWEEILEGSKRSIKSNVKSIFDPGELPDATYATKAVQREDGVWVAAPISKKGARFRQTTGITIVPEKNAAEIEMDRLGIQYYEVFRSTGIPFLDRMYKNLLAPTIHNKLSELVQGNNYKNLPNAVQVEFIKAFLKKTKTDIRKVLAADPSLVPYLMEYKLRNLTGDRKRTIKDVLGEDYLNSLIKWFQNGK